MLTFWQLAVLGADGIRGILRYPDDPGRLSTAPADHVYPDRLLHLHVLLRVGRPGPAAPRRHESRPLCPRHLLGADQTGVWFEDLGWCDHVEVATTSHTQCQPCKALNLAELHEETHSVHTNIKHTPQHSDCTVRNGKCIVE